jgi:hypothetical protein
LAFFALLAKLHSPHTPPIDLALLQMHTTIGCPLHKGQTSGAGPQEDRLTADAAPSAPLLEIEAVSGVVVTRSTPLRQARRFFFLADTQISNAAASDSLGNLAANVKGPRIWRSHRAHCG